MADRKAEIARLRRELAKGEKALAENRKRLTRLDPGDRPKKPVKIQGGKLKVQKGPSKSRIKTIRKPVRRTRKVIT